MATGRVWTEPSKWGIEELQVCWRSFWEEYEHSGSTEDVDANQSRESLKSIFVQGSIGYPFGKDCAILAGMKHPC